MRGLVTAFCLWLTTLCLSASVQAKSAPPMVAAASDLLLALTEAAALFEQESGHSLRLNFGSSGNFRRQIAQGAPFELYLSADESYVLALHQEGHVQDEGVIYAIGRLAWLQGIDIAEIDEDSPVGAIEQALAAHQAGEHQRIALANPEHAPYGVAAMEALKYAGLWEATADLHILGENVSQAAQYALDDEVRGGLVAYSLALAPSLEKRSEYLFIPEDWHNPLRQRMVLTNQAGEVAEQFYQWLQQDTGQAILNDYGFAVPR